MNRRIRLNPCDYLFRGQHRVTARKGAGGYVTYMMLDAEGDLDPGWLKQAFANVLAAHPVALGRFGCTLLTGRPMWIVSRDAASEALQSAQSAFHHENWERDADWQSKLEFASSIGNAAGWESLRAPLARLEHYSLPNRRHRVILRWPHPLMDADGAQWFLSELARCGDGAEPRPSELSDDGEWVDPLRRRPFSDRVRLFIQGAGYQRTYNKAAAMLLPPDSTTGAPDHRVIHRVWAADEVKRIQEYAKRVTPPGPLLYARHLAACVLRAIHDLFLQKGVETGHYLITVPMRVGVSDPASDLFKSRPVAGNYLVAPIVCVPRDQMDDVAAVGRIIQEQLTDYLARRGDILQWTMMWAASLIHAWVYDIIFSLPFEGGRYATGFSYYGEIARPLRKLGGAKVVNLWGGGPNTTPPALNPTFSRFDDRLNLTLTYTMPAVSDATAADYVRLIERELFAP